jgi:vitamin B12/bleomycin/antimicrobial peptide transport system ATP-binding/permease protein
VKRFVATIAAIWRLTVPYFRSDDRWPGRILLGAVIAIELSLVALQVILNEWYNRFYNTLQDRDWSAFVSAILFFCVLAAIYTVLVVYQTYLNQWLQIRWRRWMTNTYLERWLDSANHYRMQLLGDAADNPDQRISEDIRMFIDSGTGAGILPLGVGLLSSVVTLGSFVVILWHLSVTAPLKLGGWAIPGYLVWAAVLYAVVGTLLTHWIGWKLIPLNFQQQQFEADFRFNLVRTRENAEQIAALSGEAAERERHLGRFSRVVENWIALMRRQKRLTFLTQSYSQAAVIFPYIMVSPAYFSGAMQLGGMMQTASAFGQVQSALSYFVSAYRSLAEFRAVLDRLTGFEEALALGRAAAVAAPAIEVEPRETSHMVTIDRLDVRLPGGGPIAVAGPIAFAPGDHVLFTGPSGAGKSTLFRAITGIWPFGSGHVAVPKDAKIMLLPQRPYFPVAALATAIGYPATAGTFDDASVAAALIAVGLPELAVRLHEEAHWNRMLSLGEQQRLAIARALLHRPDVLFLDEATASLDEPAEAALYRLLQEKLKGATVVSIGHRSTLGAFHRRRVELIAEGDVYRVREVTLAPAAE